MIGFAPSHRLARRPPKERNFCPGERCGDCRSPSLACRRHVGRGQAPSRQNFGRDHRRDLSDVVVAVAAQSMSCVRVGADRITAGGTSAHERKIEHAATAVQRMLRFNSCPRSSIPDARLEKYPCSYPNRSRSKHSRATIFESKDFICSSEMSFATCDQGPAAASRTRLLPTPMRIIQLFAQYSKIENSAQPERLAGPSPRMLLLRSV